MGKYLEALKTGDPNRKVSNQELMNVMGEFLEESIAILKEANNKIAEDVVAVKVRPKSWLLRKLGPSIN